MCNVSLQSYLEHFTLKSSITTTKYKTCVTSNEKLLNHTRRTYRNISIFIINKISFIPYKNTILIKLYARGYRDIGLIFNEVELPLLYWGACYPLVVIFARDIDVHF